VKSSPTKRVRLPRLTETSSGRHGEHDVGAKQHESSQDDTLERCRLKRSHRACGNGWNMRGADAIEGERSRLKKRHARPPRSGDSGSAAFAGGSNDARPNDGSKKCEGWIDRAPYRGRTGSRCRASMTRPRRQVWFAEWLWRTPWYRPSVWGSNARPMGGVQRSRRGSGCARRARRDSRAALANVRDARQLEANAIVVSDQTSSSAFLDLSQRWCSAASPVGYEMRIRPGLRREQRLLVVRFDYARERTSGGPS
jgi:hypothetical protein